jgi:hypothetical protein
MDEMASWLPAATGLIGALAALGGQLIAGRVQRRNQELAEQRQRRERAGEVLALVTALYEDSNPNLLVTDDDEQELDALWGRRDRVRTPLLMLATVHPSARVRYAAGTLDVLLHGSLNAVAMAHTAQDEDQAEHWETARSIYGKAGERLGELINAVQQE